MYQIKNKELIKTNNSSIEEILESYQIKIPEEIIDSLEHTSFYIISSFFGLAVFLICLIVFNDFVSLFFCILGMFISYLFCIIASWYEYKYELLKQLNSEKKIFVCSCIKKNYIYVNHKQILKVNSNKINSNNVRKINDKITLFNFEILN